MYGLIMRLSSRFFTHRGYSIRLHVQSICVVVSLALVTIANRSSRRRYVSRWHAYRRVYDAKLDVERNVTDFQFVSSIRRLMPRWRDAARRWRETNKKFALLHNLVSCRLRRNSFVKYVYRFHALRVVVVL